MLDRSVITLQDLRNIGENYFLTRALTLAKYCLVSSGAVETSPLWFQLENWNKNFN